MLLLSAAAALVFPLAGIPAIVAAYYIFPGIVLVVLLGKGVTALESIIIALVSSVLVSTQLAYYASLLAGYTQPVLALLAGALCLGVLAFKKPVLSKVEKKALVAGAIVFLLFFAIYSNNLYSERNGSIIVGGWNWSDLFIHLPIIKTINAGNFPPEMPFFAGAPMQYHYFTDLHSAIVAKAAGLDAMSIVRAENAFYAALFTLACFALALRVTGKPKTAAIAALLIVFGGGFAYLKLAGDLQHSSLDALLAQSGYDNDGGFYQIPSLLGGYLIVQRPQMVGLCALVVVALALLAAREQRSWRLFLLAGIVAALTAPFHYYAFATSFILIVLFLALEAWREKRVEWRNALAALAPGVLALPFALPALLATSGAGHVQLNFLWLAPHSPIDAAVFYVANLGLPVLLALAALASRNTKQRMFLGLWALACFVIPNVVSLSGTVWDMAKFFTYMWIPIGVLAAQFLEGKHVALIVAAVALSVATPLLILHWNASSDWVAFSQDDVAVGEWIALNTPQKSVFVTTTTHLSPVDSIGGRLRVIGYLGWLYNFGLNYSEREALVKQVYCGDAQSARAAALRLDADYVYSGGTERNDFPCAGSLDAAFALVHAAGANKVYVVK